MKLLEVVWNFPETVMQPFEMYYFYWPLREAIARGWQAEVLTFQVDERQPVDEIIDDIRVRRCPAGVRKGHPLSRAFLQALLTTDADIVHCHGYGELRSELAILIARLRGIPVVFTPHFHHYPYHRPVREVYDKTVGRMFCNLSSCVVVFTHYTYRQLRRLGVRREKLRVVPHVSRPHVFASHGDEEVGTLLRQTGVTGSPLLLGVGQLIERKGWEYTVRCLPAIVQHFPEAKLLIIGPSQPADPVFRGRLLALAQQLGVLNHIQIRQDNTPAFIRDAYRSATLLTHPSFVESFGMVLLEAMTAGLPVVAHSGTGIPCILDDGVTGYVVDVRDTQHYIQALLALLNNATMRDRMSTEGRKQAQTRFGQAQVAQQLFAVYEELLDGKPPSRKIGNTGAFLTHPARV